MSKKNKTLIKIAITTLILIAFIWGLGPYLAINGRIFLSSPLIRLIASIVVLAASLSIAIPLIISHATQTTEIFDSTQTAMDQLRRRTKIVLGVIKKQPWILLLGHKEAGKTTLLEASDLNLSPFKNNQTIDWWINKQVAFIDPAGDYCFSAADSIEEKYWLSFLNFIKKKRHPQLFDQVVIVLDSASLLAPNYDFDLFAQNLGRQLQILASYHRTLSLTFLVTQCDRLAGFSEFFADLGPEERNQSVGFTLTHNTENLSIHDLWQQRAGAFIKRLGERLIWRLHHEQNLNRRAQIKDFLWQMEQLNNNLAKIFNYLPLEFSLQFQHVYYTSSLQSGAPINTLTKSIATNFHLIDTKTLNPAVRYKPYFIHDLFQQLLAETSQMAATHSSTYHWRRLVSYPLALAIVIAAVAIWHQAYEKNIAALSIIQTHINAPSGEVPWLSQLDALAQTLNALNEYGITRDRWLGFGQVVKLRNQLQTTYQHLLTTTFVLYLDQILTKQIQDDINNNQPELYKSLQVYLMLIQSDHFNTSEITNWFKQFWANRYNSDPVEQQLLMTHLTNLLQLPRHSWPVNYHLIKNAQQVLQQRPLTQIAFMMLQTQYPQTTLLLPDQTISGFDLSHATIPALYSTDNFSNIYNHVIPQIATQVERGNWVIGKTDANVTTTTSADSLTHKLRVLYLQNYIAAWQSALNQIQLLPPKNLSDIQNDIQLLTDNQSPLWKTLKNALDNSVLQNHLNDSDVNATGLLNLLSFMHQNDDYKKMQQNLQSLNDYIHPILSEKISSLAFDNAAKRMQNNHDDPITHTLDLSQQLPTPINQWLQTLSNGVWQNILEQAHIYINAQWATNVIPEYQAGIANRYPIFKNDQQDISVDDFNHFFGPGGTVENFFNRYLKPFVNTNQVYWTWKKVDGGSLNIPQANLDMLIRASMIQKMFYRDNHESPMVRFALTPISLSPNISNFILNIGGQKIEYAPGVKNTSHVSWPGEQGAFITMRFITLNPQHPHMTMNGFWAWFHLLDQSHLQTTNDPKTFQITFTLQGNQAVYQLVADNPVNPYQPQLLASFRCPNSL